MTMLAPPPQTDLPAAPPRRRSRDLGVMAAVAASVLLVVVGSVYPLTAVLSTALSGEALPRYAEFVTSEVDLKILRNTLVLGLLVGTFGTALGFLFAFVQTRLAVPGKRILHVVALVPVVSPPFAVATAAIVLYGRRGAVTHGLLGVEYDIYGLDGLVLRPVAVAVPGRLPRHARHDARPGPGDGGGRDEHGRQPLADLPDRAAAAARPRAGGAVPAAVRRGDRRPGQPARARRRLHRAGQPGLPRRDRRIRHDQRRRVQPDPARAVGRAVPGPALLARPEDPHHHHRPAVRQRAPHHRLGPVADLRARGARRPRRGQPVRHRGRRLDDPRVRRGQHADVRALPGGPVRCRSRGAAGHDPPGGRRDPGRRRLRAAHRLAGDPAPAPLRRLARLRRHPRRGRARHRPRHRLPAGVPAGPLHRRPAGAPRAGRWHRRRRAAPWPSCSPTSPAASRPDCGPAARP